MVFFKEVLSALLVQTSEADSFFCQDEDFIDFRTTLSLNEATRLYSSDTFIRNPFILSHFRFALFILEKISVVNSKLQHKYMTMPLAWVLVNNLKDEFFHCFADITRKEYGNFTYLKGMNEQQLSSFK